MDDHAGRLPTRFVTEGPAPHVELRDLGASSLRAPFFEQEAPGRRDVLRLGLDELEALPGATDPAGLVLHCSRCGSTLLSRLLGGLRETVALSEPAVVDEVLRSGLPPAERDRWLRAVVRALCRPTPAAPGRRFLKLDAWSVAERPTLRRLWPDVPWVFVYREPEAVVASHLRRPGSHVVPGLVLAPEAVGLDLQAALDLPPGGYAARVVAELLRLGLEHLDGRGRLVHHDELLSDAGRVATFGHLGAFVGPQDLEALDELALADAKEPAFAFDPTTRVVGDDARAAATVAQAPYAALEAARTGDAPRRVGAPRRVRLPLRFDAAALEADVAALGEEAWTPHFNTRLFTGDWSGVALRAVPDAPVALHPDATAAGPWEATAALEASPALRAAVARFACPQRSVRLLRLGPGATVREHRDHGLGHSDGEIRVHVPISTSPGAVFRHDGEEVAMAAGEAWYTDVRLPHAVANHGDGDRVHLVLDLVVDDWVDELLAAGEPA